MSLKELEQLVPKADHSTLFRNVKVLVDEGLVKQIVAGKNRVLYEGADHKHDHLVCSDCGGVEAVHLPRPKNIDFEVQELVARGACADCSTKRV